METISIQGKVIHTIYRDEKTRYTVARFRLYELNEKMITITGYFPEFQSDLLLNLTGIYLDHPRFGMQFQVQHYHRVLPNEPDSIITFLSSPLFPGIGKKFAEAIVEMWQEDALNVLKEDPSRLKEIKGYTPKKEESLINGLINYGEDEEAIRFFTTNGLGIRNILRLDRVYGKDAYRLVKENPYRLIDEVDGIGFKIADKLALNMGFDWDDPRRLMAGLCAMTMEECMRTGDSYVEFNRLEILFSTQFNDNSLDFSNLLHDAVRQTKLIQIGEKIFHPSQYVSEQYIAHALKEFPYLELQPVDDTEIMTQLDILQRELNIEYDESQKEAILTFFHSPFTIMTGGPGTGKSTVIGAMIHLWKRLYPSYSLACAAPTGRASKRLFELNGVESFTIHSLLKWDLESNTFGMDETNPLSIDCLI
ncbi:MAG TPA: helix-hairpin-helix domain-containing protein, partial [Erysipelotrichaceae bacterium]|nr:helix-hairpin-helix domain-containing protein [Erysipelotrichaceae bacterium]